MLAESDTRCDFCDGRHAGGRCDRNNGYDAEDLASHQEWLAEQASFDDLACGIGPLPAEQAALGSAVAEVLCRPAPDSRELLVRAHEALVAWRVAR